MFRIFIFLLGVVPLRGQVGIHGGFYVVPEGSIGVHASDFLLHKGILRTDNNSPGNIFLLSNTTIHQASHQSYSEVPVVSFSDKLHFPVGGAGVYHPLNIRAINLWWE